MPEIFTKDCKLNVIEYGGHYDPRKSWECFRNDVKAFFSKFFRR